MGGGIEFLRPTGKTLIIDCVREAGIDVSDWSLTKDRRPVARPQSNGAYCYDWSFRSKDNRVMVVCVWFEEMKMDAAGRIVFAGNLKHFADSLVRELEKDPRNRKRTIKDPRVSRAGYFSSTVELAYLNAIPLKVVVVSGPIRQQEDDEGEGEFDHAVGRQLDSHQWVVESFDKDTGAFVLVRGGGDQIKSKSELVDDADGNSVEGAIIADQFSTEQRPDTYIYNGIQRYRDPNVRRMVLVRSKGVCELTGVPGFLMVNGGAYLETHHIIPLSEGGTDGVENVIALTADAHRQAHFAANRDELRAHCLEIVARRTGN